MITKGSNLYLTRGDTASITYEVHFEENVIIKAFYFTMKKSPFKQNEPLIFKEWKQGEPEEDIELKESNNTYYKFIVDIKHEDTKNLEFGSYRYDVQINYNYDNDLNEKILTIIKPSIFEIMEEITEMGILDAED